MLGQILTKIYTLFVAIFGLTKPATTLDMEIEDEPKPELTKYQENLLRLQDAISDLPESITSAGDFDPINYRMVISKFGTIKQLLSNLTKIRDKYQETVADPQKATTDIHGFITISYMSDNGEIIAKFLTVDGKYLNIKEVLRLIKKCTEEVSTLYTQMKELEDLDEDFIPYFERITQPTILEVIVFIERLHAIGADHV